MRPQKPFKVNYTFVQGYYDNMIGYAEGHHGAIDLVPRNAQDLPYPAEIYPIFDGSTISTSETSVTLGKGIKEKVICDLDFIRYLKAKGLVPSAYNGSVSLEILYWHILQVLDHDGTLTQNTPIAITGNTGNVYHDGKPVPNDQKGVYPYLGLHLHLEVVIKGGTTIFNKDKDSRGRVDPVVILSYEGQSMNETKVALSKDGHTVYECTPIAIPLDQYKKQAGVQGIVVPDIIPAISSL